MEFQDCSILAKMAVSHIQQHTILFFTARGLTYRWKMPIAYFAAKKMVNAFVLALPIPRCVISVQSWLESESSFVCDQGSAKRNISYNPLL